MAKGYRLTASTGIHKGDREYQQDQIALLSHPRYPGCVLGVVADGMGGRSGGRKASNQVMLTARQLFERYSPDHDDAQALLKQMASGSQLVVKVTADGSEQEPHRALAACRSSPAGDCKGIDAGDSRMYHCHSGKLIKRNMDHSYVQTLVDRGELTEDEANVHPQSNILMGCLGAEDDPPMDVHFVHEMRPGDVLMACSDGVWHYFTSNELGSVLSSLSAREAAEFLIEKARSRGRGGGDNLSLVVVKLEPLDD